VAGETPAAFAISVIVMGMIPPEQEPFYRVLLVKNQVERKTFAVLTFDYRIISEHCQVEVLRPKIGHIKRLKRHKWAKFGLEI
jgi:hypothetical protein